MPFRAVRLGDDDLVCLVHVPRTGGTTLYELLAAKFRPHERRGNADLDSMDGGEIALLRLLAGPIDTSVAQVVGRVPRFVTMLREPASRMKSHYESARRTRHHPLRRALTGGMTFLEWIQHPDGGQAQADRQVRQIAGALHQAPLDRRGRIDRWGLLEQARERLDEFVFFGILERFDESVRLLADTFGWEPFDHVPHLNPTAADNHRLRLDARELEAVHEVTELDFELYAHADELFRHRAASLDDLSARLPGAMHG